MTTFYDSIAAIKIDFTSFDENMKTIQALVDKVRDNLVAIEKINFDIQTTFLLSQLLWTHCITLSGHLRLNLWSLLDNKPWVSNYFVEFNHP